MYTNKLIIKFSKERNIKKSTMKGYVSALNSYFLILVFLYISFASLNISISFVGFLLIYSKKSYNSSSVSMSGVGSIGLAISSAPVLLINVISYYHICMINYFF